MEYASETNLADAWLFSASVRRACIFSNTNVSLGSPQIPQVSYVVRNRRSGKLLATQSEKALSLLARTRGLLGRSSLGAGGGLWIEPCSSIHMFFMRFPIDAVFVDRSSIVTRTFPGLLPWRIAIGGRGARAVLELPVGVISASDTRIGDRLDVIATTDG